MIDYQLSNNKKLRVYDFYDFVLVNVDPERGDIFYRYSDNDSIHCVKTVNYAYVFQIREQAQNKSEEIKNKFGLEFNVIRKWL